MSKTELISSTTSDERRQATVTALRQAITWGVGAFLGSALLVALVAGLAIGLGGAIALPVLLVALALGLAAGWTAGIVVFRHETTRLLTEVAEARVAQARRNAARAR